MKVYIMQYDSPYEKGIMWMTTDKADFEKTLDYALNHKDDYVHNLRVFKHRHSTGLARVGDGGFGYLNEILPTQVTKTRKVIREVEEEYKTIGYEID